MKLPAVTKQVRTIDHKQAGTLVREARKKKKMSLRELAERLGFSAAYLSDLERGRRNWSASLFEEVSVILK